MHIPSIEYSNYTVSIHLHLYAAFIELLTMNI